MVGALSFLVGLWLGWHTGCSWLSTIGGLLLATLLTLALAGLLSLAGVAFAVVRTSR